MSVGVGTMPAAVSARLSLRAGLSATVTVHTR